MAMASDRSGIAQSLLYLASLFWSIRSRDNVRRHYGTMNHSLMVSKQWHRCRSVYPLYMPIHSYRTHLRHTIYQRRIFFIIADENGAVYIFIVPRRVQEGAGFCSKFYLFFAAWVCGYFLSPVGIVSGIIGRWAGSFSLAKFYQ